MADLALGRALGCPSKRPNWAPLWPKFARIQPNFATNSAEIRTNVVGPASESAEHGLLEPDPASGRLQRHCMRAPRVRGSDGELRRPGHLGRPPGRLCRAALPTPSATLPAPSAALPAPWAALLAGSANALRRSAYTLGGSAGRL